MEVKNFTTILQTIVIAKYNMNNMKLYGILNNYLPQELKGHTLARKSLIMTASLPVCLFCTCWDPDSKYVEDVIEASKKSCNFRAGGIRAYGEVSKGKSNTQVNACVALSLLLLVGPFL
ncbi:MAG: hypothetical protein IPJ75_15670 [Ignavibacteriales bacterium]|nr:hypothetical protein [Ignavibacteriales bacterium]